MLQILAVLLQGYYYWYSTATSWTRMTSSFRKSAWSVFVRQLKIPRVSLQNPCDSTWTTFRLSRNDQSLVQFNYFSRVLDFQTFEYVPIWTTNYKWRQIVNSNLVDPRKLHERAAPSAWWRLLYSTVVWSFIYSPSLIAPPCTLEYVIQGTSATVHVYCQVAL